VFDELVVCHQRLVFKVAYSFGYFLQIRHSFPTGDNMRHAILNILSIMGFSIVVWLTGYPEIVAAEDAVTDGLMQEERPMPDIPFAQAPPVIDGDLNDVIWEKARIKLGDWISYNPLRGETIEQKTEVFIAYDKKNLYFAFRCLDPEPDKIKTSISRRDSLFQDDWIGLSLDAMGNGQLSYDMFVNPSGIQADILTSASNEEDLGVDWVWYSAGKRDENGYSTEIQLPLKSIRFKSGSQVRMGILFWRRVSRLGVSVSWPAIPDGQWVFKCNAVMVMHDLKSPLVLDIIPSFTYSLNQDRADPDHWDKASSNPDVGMTLKYGLTSNITLDLTANPDFSQVESDAFQMEVNRRYPVFYSERRPFFMEGSSLFNMRSGSNMSTTVHTRRIIDPILGVKLTGTIGKFSFGTLTASDHAPGRPYNDGTANPYLGDNKLFNIGRATYSLGKGSYIGAIFTDTELGDSFNRVVGSDFYLSIREHHHLSGNYLYTRSAADSSHTRSGMEGYASYTYLSRRFTFSPQIEHYDDDFQMDTAFYNRTGITMGSAYMDVNFYPNKEKYPWLKRIIPSFNYRYGRDRIAGGIERSAQISLDFRLTRQGFFGISYRAGKEPWAHQSFKTDGVSFYGT
jgi:hypothetical protein